MTTIAASLAQAQLSLSNALDLPKTEAGLEGRILLQASLNVNRAWLLSHENDALEPNIHAAFEALIKRRLNGEPIAYILGKREFYGLELRVTPDTLIPRPDTETLVEAALKKIPVHHACSILDLGTGTGAIAMAIATHRPLAQVTATDVSPAALAVAQSNAKNLDISNIEFVLGDWFSALQGQRFDVIVSNPPYIAENDEHLRQGDLRFEPKKALASGNDGLNDIRKIIQAASQHLKPQGWLMLEHGYDQAKAVAALLTSAGLGSISSHLDLAGIARITVAQFIPQR